MNITETLILIFQAIIIAIVEGITEFLPISSTGHMIIVGHFINFKGEFATLFEIVIQLGAILAVVFLFRQKIGDSLKNLKPGEEGFKLWIGLMLAFIPAGFIGVLFHSKIEEYLMNPFTVALALLVGGFWMIYAENKYRNNNKILDIKDVGYKEAFVIGCFQCLSLLFPGFSRSASTIIGGWVMGLSNIAAAEFSFFLAIPTMAIATSYQFLKADFVMTATEVVALIVGFIVSFLVAMVVVAKFIDYLKTKPMKVFAVYRIYVGVTILLLYFFKIL